MEYTNKKGQVVGTLKEGIFRKIVNKERHLMKIYDAWGIDYDVLLDLKAKGCTEIRVKETKENVVYTISFGDFFGKAHVSSFGDGEQAFCPRQFFNVVGRKDDAPLVVRNNKEQLIADIVNRTDEKDKKWLAKRIAIAMNTLKWSSDDLHALLKKADDPTVHNYTALVKYSCTIRG
jgi:hypothetical protein